MTWQGTTSKRWKGVEACLSWAPCGMPVLFTCIGDAPVDCKQTACRFGFTLGYACRLNFELTPSRRKELLMPCRFVWLALHPEQRWTLELHYKYPPAFKAACRAVLLAVARSTKVRPGG